MEFFVGKLIVSAVVGSPSKLPMSGEDGADVLQQVQAGELFAGSAFGPLAHYPQFVPGLITASHLFDGTHSAGESAVAFAIEPGARGGDGVGEQDVELGIGVGNGEAGFDSGAGGEH